MPKAIGFFPTTNIPRAHTALSRLWRHDMARNRLDAIFVSPTKRDQALALGWDEMGKLEEVPDGWTGPQTFANFEGSCDVLLLKPGETAYYANCQRAAAGIGTPSWVSWQEGPVASSPLAEGPLLSELVGSPIPDFRGHGSFEEFWRVVDKEDRFVWLIRLDAIGDLLLTLSYLLAFKKKYPRRRVGMIVRDRHAEWVRQASVIDAICGVDIVHWDRLNREAPADDGRSAWINMMPGMLRVGGNRLLAERGGPRASVHPESTTRCEFSPGRQVLSQRELLSEIFCGVEPELPVQRSRQQVNGEIWFSPQPGMDERLWPPDSWVAALRPLAGRRLVMQSLNQRWEAEFLALAASAGLHIEFSRPTKTIFDLAEAMSNCSAWVGINSAPMHVAGLLGLSSLAVGLPWERNDMWEHPSVRIVAAEKYAQEILENPSTEKLHAFLRDTERQDNWADGLYLRPEEFATALEGKF